MAKVKDDPEWMTLNISRFPRSLGEDITSIVTKADIRAHGKSSNRDWIIWALRTMVDRCNGLENQFEKYDKMVVPPPLILNQDGFLVDQDGNPRGYLEKFNRLFRVGAHVNIQVAGDDGKVTTKPESAPPLSPEPRPDDKPVGEPVPVFTFYLKTGGTMTSSCRTVEEAHAELGITEHDYLSYDKATDNNS